MSQANVFRISGLVSQKQSNAKLALPVDGSAILYSRYKHVRGTNPLGQTNGMPLSKLRALDNLIDRLVRLKSNKPIVRNTVGLNDQELKGLIRNYREELHRVISGRGAALSEVRADATAVTLNIVA